MDPTPEPVVLGGRSAAWRRTTKESDIALEVSLDGEGAIDVSTGLPFFDHMLEQLGRHGGMVLRVAASGDLDVDAHHLVEDTGIVFGAVLRAALGAKEGIRRFASLLLPLDEALVSVALDLSGRPYLYYDVPIAPDSPKLGDPGFDPQLAEEFVRAVMVAGGITAHVELVRGKNSHHIVEATFKALARAIRDACRVEGVALPSTKGVL